MKMLECKIMVQVITINILVPISSYILAPLPLGKGLRALGYRPGFVDRLINYSWIFNIQR